MKADRHSRDGDLDRFLEDPNFADSPIFLNPVVDYQKAHATSQQTVDTELSSVLVIYTGGTIGMKACSGQGYIPVPNWFYDTLFKINRFNDQTFPFPSVQTINYTVCKEGVAAGVCRREQKALVTPQSIYGKRIKYVILEYDPLLDSADMTMDDWVKIASDIELNYDMFDAFVVVHGTDTMAYTASALSFMLEDLSKTVILTGSQVPLAEWRTDAEENLLCALLISGHFVIPEVCLYFEHKLFRGNRCTKVNAMDFAAFDSPNLKPLAEMGVNVNINWKEIRGIDDKDDRELSVHKNLNRNVATLRLFPGITASTVKAFLSPPIEGVVLETYGAGNAPSSRKDLLEIIREACTRGVVMVNCTQCKRGMVSELYATGKALAALGVVPGADMTAECALTKLSYLLGKGRSPEEIRILMQRSLRGELTIKQ